MDYYCHTAFVPTYRPGRPGTQSTGRYDGLVSEMGGPVTPGIGWPLVSSVSACLINTPPEEQRPTAVIPTGQDNNSDALMIAHQPRRKGFLELSTAIRNVGKRLKRAIAANGVYGYPR